MPGIQGYKTGSKRLKTDSHPVSERGCEALGCGAIRTRKVREAVSMKDWMTTVDAAEKWNITRQRVLTLCKEGRIPGAEFHSPIWLIPVKAKKPADARTKRGKR